MQNWKIIAVTTAIIVGLAGVRTVRAEEPDHCLDNSGQYTVSAGVTYDDAGGAWVCAPRSPQSGVGGWLRQPAATPSVPPKPPAANAPPRASAGNSGRQYTDWLPRLSFWWVAVAAPFAGVAIAAGLLAALRRRRLSGFLDIEEVRRVGA